MKVACGEGAKVTLPEIQDLPLQSISSDATPSILTVFWSVAFGQHLNVFLIFCRLMLPESGLFEVSFDPLSRSSWL